jgi:hypothetical protein
VEERHQFYSVGVKKLTDRTKKEALIKVAVEPFRPSTSINKQLPEGIFDRCASEVLKAIAPSTSYTWW